MQLEHFLRSPRLWSWGGTPVPGHDGAIAGDDCTTFAASWCREVIGADPADGLRGTYSTAAEANAIVAGHGGIAALIDARLAPLSIGRTAVPADGDIGIVETMTGFEADGAAVKSIPAIRFGPLWAVMSARGVMVKHLDWTGVAWRVR